MDVYKKSSDSQQQEHLITIDYCPEDSTFRCLGNTITTSVIAGFLLIFGSFQLYVYRTYLTRHRYVNRLGKSKLFNLQVGLSILVPVLALAEFIFQCSNGRKIYGFTITTVVLTCFAYLFSTCITLNERYYRLKSGTTRGHGVVLLVFWALALIAENISISYLQYVATEIIFLVLRYASVLMIFILGLNAPGILKDIDDRQHLLDAESEGNGSLSDVESNIPSESESPKECQIQTTIIVPHRLSTLITTEEIVVLSEGVIVEKGRHGDLLTLNGTYATIWLNQLQNLYAEQDNDDALRARYEESEEKLPEAAQPPSMPPPIPPPMPPTPTSSALPPPPPPLLLGALLLPSMPSPLPVTKKKVPKPGNALKSFNWSKLSDIKIKETIWSELTDSKLYADTELLQSIDTTFSAGQKNGVDNDGSAEQLEKGRPKNVSVIDGRRAQNCTILLSKLKLSDKEISKAILSMDASDQLATDMVEQLLKFTPSPEEKLLLEEHSKHFDTLVRAEKFLYEISQIPDYEERLMSLLYKKQFEATVNDLLSRITSVMEASREVRSSRRLKKLLEIILDLGNYLNYGPRGNASGFHLASLNCLVDTKSSSIKGLTLFHYLVQLIENKFEDLLSIPEEMPQVRLACKVSLVEIDKDTEMLRTGLAKASDFTTKEFYEQATDKFQGVENQLNEMKLRFDEVTRRFGEDGSIMQPDEFFGIFNDFFTAFEEARQDNLKKLTGDGERRAKQEAELKKLKRSTSEGSHLKQNFKSAKSVFRTDKDMEKRRERQNNQRHSSYNENENRER